MASAELLDEVVNMAGARKQVLPESRLPEGRKLYNPYPHAPRTDK